MAEAIDFYKTKKWLRLRAKILRRDGYLCQASKRFGKMRPAEVVHHIYPRGEFPAYTWEVWNLVSLSKEAHNKMHDRNADKLTEYGADLLRRTARKYDRPIPDEYAE